MRKEEAATFLGISVRTLELYTQQSRIGGHYEKGKTRSVLVYDEEEVKRFKAELEGQSYPHRPVVVRSGAGQTPTGQTPRGRPLEGQATKRRTGAGFSEGTFGDQPV